MSSKKLSNNQSTLATHASRVVKFTAEADQELLQAIESALNDGSYSNFNDLCKRALRQLLLTSTSSQPASPEPAPDTGLVLLQQQMLLLQQQLSHLEGAMGMKQIISLNRLEQQIAQLDQRTTEQANQLTQRLDQLESCKFAETHASKAPEIDINAAELTSAEPLLDDPLLSRLMPLLEDF